MSRGIPAGKNAAAGLNAYWPAWASSSRACRSLAASRADTPASATIAAEAATALRKKAPARHHR